MSLNGASTLQVAFPTASQTSASNFAQQLGITSASLLESYSQPKWCEFRPTHSSVACMQVAFPTASQMSASDFAQQLGTNSSSVLGEATPGTSLSLASSPQVRCCCSMQEHVVYANALRAAVLPGS